MITTENCTEHHLTLLEPVQDGKQQAPCGSWRGRGSYVLKEQYEVFSLAIRTPTFHSGCVTWGTVLGRAYQRAQNRTAEHMWPTSEDFHHSCDISPQYQRLHCLPAGAAQQAVRQLLLGPLTRFWGAADAIILFPHLKMTSLALRMRKMYRNHLVPSLAYTSGDHFVSPSLLCGQRRQWK